MEYTLLEAARELGFTKNAVKYRAAKLPSEVIQKSDEGILYISSEGIEILRCQMGKKSQPDKETPSTTQEPPNKTDKPDNNHETTTKEPTNNHQRTAQQPNNNCTTTTKEPDKKPLSNAETTALLAAVEALTAQLTAKDEQISALIRQNETLTETLKTAQQTAAQAQVLHAGTIQRELLKTQKPSQTEAVPSTEPETIIYKKNGLFSWFGRLKSNKKTPSDTT